MVLVALVMLLLAVLQVGLYVHVRNVVVAGAAEGARAGAVVGAGPARAREQTRQVLSGALGRTGRSLSVTAAPGVHDGLPVMTVRVSGRVPTVLSLAGAVLPLEAEANALREGP